MEFDMDKVTSEIFSILENKFLFGYNETHYYTPTTTTTGRSSHLSNLLLSHHSTGKVRILSIHADANNNNNNHNLSLSLTHLQSSLRLQSSDPDAHISDFFDVVTGSGSGGLLASLLFTRGPDGRPLCSAEQALHLLHHSRRPTNVFRRIFRRMFSKSSSSVVKMLGDLTLKDTLKSVLIPCYDLSTRAPFLFSRVDAVEMEGCDFSMADVCMATSADRKAVVEIMSVDGKTRIQATGSAAGAVKNSNPTAAAAITHVLNNKQEFPFCNGVEDLLVVSIGNNTESSSMEGGIVSQVVKEHERRKTSVLPTVILKQPSSMHSPKRPSSSSSSSSSTTFSSSS